MLQKFKFDGFLQEIENGNILVDFDARTGHNHGTKFRMRKHCLPSLYEHANVVVQTDRLSVAKNGIASSLN